MKQLGLLVVFACITNCILAQDVIVKRDGTEIEVNVVEVHEDEIHYTKFDNPDGPIYILSVVSLKEIRYESGDIEDYSNEGQSGYGQQKPNRPAKKKTNEEITVRSNQFYYQGKQISTKKVKLLFAEHHAEEAMVMWNRSNMNQGFSIATNIISYPVVIISYINPVGLFNPSLGLIISVGGYLVSAGLQVVSFYVFRPLSHDQRLEAVGLYNEALKDEGEHSNDDYY